MRGKIHRQPAEGEWRTITKFLWFPKILHSLDDRYNTVRSSYFQSRWLEIASILQRYDNWFGWRDFAWDDREESDKP